MQKCIQSNNQETLTEMLMERDNFILSNMTTFKLDYIFCIISEWGLGYIHVFLIEGGWVTYNLCYKSITIQILDLICIQLSICFQLCEMPGQSIHYSIQHIWHQYGFLSWMLSFVFSLHQWSGYRITVIWSRKPLDIPHFTHQPHGLIRAILYLIMWPCITRTCSIQHYRTSALI